MTIVIDAPAEIEAAITEKAEQSGLSVSEYTLRVLLENAVRQEQPKQTKHKLTREEMKARVRSGYYVKPGISSDRLIADRREEVRRELEQEAARA